jgi:hypothetical protein
VESGSGAFSVKAPGCSVQVSGTEFFVAVSGGRTAVSVLEGSVTLRSGDRTLGLGPGQRGLRLPDGALQSAADSAEAEPPFMSSDALALSLGTAQEGRVLVFRIANIADRPFLLRADNPAYPHFMLRVLGDEPRDFIVNLNAFFLSADGIAKDGSARLAPGTELKVRFNLTELLSDGFLPDRPGWRVQGVYHAARRGVETWSGRLVSEETNLRSPDAADGK